MPTRTELRKMMCTKRCAVSEATAEMASKQLAEKVLSLSVIRNARHIAGYFTSQGEIDPRYIAEKLLEQEKAYYLPVLDIEQPNYLIFVHYRQGDALILNRYKIPEPDVLNQNKQHPESLDVVLLP